MNGLLLELSDNPYLAIIKSSEQIAEWKRQGLSDEKIRELSIKDGVISSVLALVDINGVTNLLNNGASKEEVVKFAMITAFGRAASGSSKTSKVTDGSGEATSKDFKTSFPDKGIYLPPQEIDSPCFIRIDPISDQGPMAIDTSKFTSGPTTMDGGIRNSKQFWEGSGRVHAEGP